MDTRPPARRFSINSSPMKMIFQGLPFNGHSHLTISPPLLRYALDVKTGEAVGGSMSLREQLHAYIAELEKRLRWSTLLRGLAILTCSALVATLVLVTIANALAFSNGSVTAARFVLILVLAIAAAAG